MFTAILFSFGVVVLAEMGDKTQLLAMAFATRYNASKVMLGVFIATIFNHTLAVAVGNLLTRFSGVQLWIQIIASISFLIFALWTIRGDKLDGEDKKEVKFGAVLTVTIAFFFAEMGDKTQLATIALATKFPADPIAILIGTTTGMLVADGIGILIGIVLKKRIPEHTIKLIAASAFAIFGLLGIYQSLMYEFRVSLTVTIGVLAAVACIIISIAVLIMKSEQQMERDS